MGDWYTIGLAAGLGAAIGLLFAGLLSATPLGRAAAAVLAAAAGVLAGFAIEDWTEALGGGASGLVGGFAATVIVAGALRRGGTRGGTALLVAATAILLAAVAFVPVLGYLEALALPVLAVRLRRRAGERYAGLRTLAK